MNDSKKLIWGKRPGNPLKRIKQAPWSLIKASATALSYPQIPRSGWICGALFAYFLGKQKVRPTRDIEQMIETSSLPVRRLAAFRRVKKIPGQARDDVHIALKVLERFLRPA